MGKAPVQEQQIFWLHRGGGWAPFPLLSQPCTGVGGVVGVVARIMQSGKAGEARSLWFSNWVGVGWGEVPKQPSG